MKQFRDDLREHRYWDAFAGLAQRKHLPLVGYLIICVSIIGAFWLLDQSRDEARRNAREAIITNCERINQATDRDAQLLYDNHRNLARDAKLLGIELTEELKDTQRDSINARLKTLIKLDCTVLPPNEPVVIPYEPIVEGEPIPNVKQEPLTNNHS